MTKRALVARFDSPCAWCGDPIRAGETYEVWGKGRFVHPVCLDAAIRAKNDGGAGI